MKYQDFGEKIGGARKDLSKGLLEGDFAKLNNRELVAYARKYYIFPTPNYAELKAKGVEPVVLFWRKKVKDALPCYPVSRNKEDIEVYIRFISTMKNLLDSIKTIQDIENKYDEIQDEVKKYPVGTRKLYETRRKQLKKIASCMYHQDNIYSYFDDLETLRFNKRFLVTPEEYVRQTILFRTEKETVDGIEKYVIHALGSSNKAMANSKEEIVTAKESLIQDEIKAEKERCHLKRNRRQRLIPEQLENIIRVGEDVRLDVNISGDDYLEEFKFRGGEFGVWLSQKDRQASLNYCYEAFKDLAWALDIKDESISFNKKLSIAFGARGKSSALAHFEPLRQVINLTKNKGAGSLAHEWGHALDFICGEMLNCECLTHSSNPVAMRLVKTMKYKENGGLTKFYCDARKIDILSCRCDKGYWSDPVEMFARAFACYVHDKLEKENKRNDYLCGHAYASKISLNDNDEIIAAYPMGKEAEDIFKCFDELIELLKQKKFLLSAKPILSENEYLEVPLRKLSRELYAPIYQLSMKL